MTHSDISWRQNLGKLLDEDVNAAANRARSALDLLGGGSSARLVLFGSGGLGRKTLAGLRSLNIEPVAFVDNNQRMWGNSVDGLAVMSPEDAAQRFGRECLFVVTIWRAQGSHDFLDAQAQLHALGCKHVAHFGHLAWKYPETFLPYYCIDLPQNLLRRRQKILEVATLFSDDYSRQQYVAQLQWRLHLDFAVLPSPVAGEQYFPLDLITLGGSESYVDCGAFDGDTLKLFLNHCKKNFTRYTAIEPDPKNFEKIQNFVSELDSAVQKKITLHQSAVGSTRTTLTFDPSGLASAAASKQGTLTVQCIPLDDILAAESPTFIKMDIEGAELDAVIGAQKAIQRHAPTLAICVYHRQDHLWTIPSYLHSLSDRYRLFLRPHNYEGWDLVLYALPAR